jgi:DNA replication protein DnaC
MGRFSGWSGNSRRPRKSKFLSLGAVMTTALLDRLLHHAKVFTLDGESYRIKKSKKEV